MTMKYGRADDRWPSMRVMTAEAGSDPRGSDAALDPADARSCCTRPDIPSDPAPLRFDNN
jgi:hypothetical protein